MEKILLICTICITLLSGCAKSDNLNVATKSEADKLSEAKITVVNHAKSTDTDNEYRLVLGEKIGYNNILLMGNYSSSNSGYEKDKVTMLGTYKTLESFMQVNYKYVDGSQESTNEEIDNYIEGYYNNTNVRTLGGTSQNGTYFTVTVYNTEDYKVKVEDGIVKSYWVLNPVDIIVEYRDFITGEYYEEYKDELSNYSKVEEPQYSDMEFNKIDGEENITIYVTDDKISGIKVIY